MSQTSLEIETLAAKLEGRSQFHARNCKGSYSYFSDADGDLMLRAAVLLRSSAVAQTPAEPVREALTKLAIAGKPPSPKHD